MEDTIFKTDLQFVQSKGKQARSLLKNCFKNVIFSFVPFEIWRDLIVSNADGKSVKVLAQTCWGFKEVVDDAGGRNLKVALSLRRDGEIELAFKFLYKCAHNENPIAMFHLGYSYFYGGFGLKGSTVPNFSNADRRIQALIWFKKSAEKGFGAAMSHVSYCLKWGFGGEWNSCLNEAWASKAFASNDPLAIGLCCFGNRDMLQVKSLTEESKRAFECFTIAAENGCEFGQFLLGECFRFGYGTEIDREKAIYWFLKSSEQGLANAQQVLSSILRNSNINEAIIWAKKAANQGKIDANTFLLREKLKKQND